MSNPLKPVISFLNGTSISNFFVNMDEETKKATIGVTLTVAIATGVAFSSLANPIVAGTLVGAYAFSCMTQNYTGVDKVGQMVVAELGVGVRDSGNSSDYSFNRFYH